MKVKKNLSLKISLIIVLLPAMHWTIDLVISFRKYCCCEQTNIFVLNTQRFGLYFHSFIARNFLSLTAVLQKLFAYTYLQYSSQPTHNWDCRHVVSTGYYPLIERKKSAIFVFSQCQASIHEQHAQSTQIQLGCVTLRS